MFDFFIQPTTLSSTAFINLSFVSIFFQIERQKSNKQEWLQKDLFRDTKQKYSLSLEDPES